jgi:hypothetical protein
LSIEAVGGSSVAVEVRVNDLPITALPLDFGTSQQVEITVDAEDEVELFNGGVNSLTLHGAPAIGAIVEIQKLEELL